MSKTIGQALVIVALAAVLALAGNAISPRGIPWIAPPKEEPKPEEFMPLARAEEVWSDGSAFFLDAREPEDFAAGHIANALNLPMLSFDSHFGEVAPFLSPESQVVVYCDGVECELSHRLSDRLKQMGFTNMHVLFNGWTAWREAGLPTEGEGTP